MGRIVNIIKQIYGKVDWGVVKNILLKFLKNKIIVKENNVTIKIDRKFIKEFAHSKYSASANKKIKNVKANIAYVIDELIENAGHIEEEKNQKTKHKNDAYLGFEKYKCRFCMEDKQNSIVSNYSCVLVVRCPNFKEKYLYDIVDIKKVSTPQR